MRTRIFFVVIIALLAFAAGGWLTWSFTRPTLEQTESQATVLLERMRKVMKLVTVEGDFVERYNETNIRNFTVYLPFPSTFSFPKQALIDVTGTVLVGFDMEQVEVEMKPDEQRIILKNLPEPSILSIDHAINYYNIEESFFNSFSAKDYTQLNKNAKEVLRKKALESDLLAEAEKQGNQLLDVLGYMASSAGWTLEVQQPDGSLILLDSLQNNRLLD